MPGVEGETRRCVALAVTLVWGLRGVVLAFNSSSMIVECASWGEGWTIVWKYIMVLGLRHYSTYYYVLVIGGI